MTGNEFRCPDVEQLAECLDPLSGEDVHLQEHLESCSQCRDTLCHLAGEATWWEDAQDRLSGSDDAAAARIARSVCALSCDDGLDGSEDPLREHETEQLQKMLQPASHPELLGRVDRYELEQMVGRGGMGLVFRARDTELHRVVAVKTLAIHLIPLGSARERFIREARASASLTHPHIVPVHDVITEGPVPALVMQYIAGPTLESWLRERGPMRWQDALQIAIQLADALAVAHQQGLVHRDIKPGNVLLEADGSRALLSDFGLVRALDDATLTRSGVLAGTPDYMSPDQARGQAVDRRSDLFSLGSLLYAMLTGHPPFRAADPMAIMNRICHQRHRPIAELQREVPVEVGRLVDKLLSKEPKRRFSSAENLRDDLQRLAGAPRHVRHRFAEPRKWALVAAAALVTLVTWGALSGRLGTHRLGSRQQTPGAISSSGQRFGESPLGTSTGQLQHRSSLAAPEANGTVTAGFIELRKLDQLLERLDHDSARVLESYAPPSPAQILSGPPPLIDINQQVNHIKADLSRLEAEVQQGSFE